MINKAGGKFPSPLRVSYFQMLANSLSMRDWHRFPSPLGVSYFQMLADSLSMRDWHRFPSPLGVSYFQILYKRFRRRISGACVSVPSRGILFPNKIFENQEFGSISFRPLSGYLISKYCSDDVQ